MKFYLAIDQDGRKQLRKTKEEIQKVNKEFLTVDIPTDQTGLMELVQDSFDEIHHLTRRLNEIGSSAPAVEGELVEPGLSDTAPPRPVSVIDYERPYEATEIEDFILNRATVNQTENILSCLGCRMAELVKENKKLRGQQEPVELDDGPTAAR